MESWCPAWAERIGPSNGNGSETKANESFDIGVFFDIKAKQKLFAKRSKLIYFETSQYRSKANRSATYFVLEIMKKANFHFFKKQKAKTEDNEISKFCHSYYVGPLSSTSVIQMFTARQ
jgi:hypothetical protein